MILRVIDKTRGLGLSLLCSGLLFGALLLLMGSLSAPTSMSTVRAATIPDSVPKSMPTSRSTVQVNADISTIEFSSTSYVMTEGVGSGKIVLRVDPPSDTPITVTVSSVSIQAEASHDFIGLREFLVISPSLSSYTLSLTILDDMWVEGDEQLWLTLGGYHGASPGVISETLVTIEDNDIAYLSISDVTVSEEADLVSLVITQSVTSTLESLVDVRTVDGSATSPDDFSALIATTAVISPGETAVTVAIPLHGDSEVEGTESFIVRLEDATNAQLASMTATMTATVTLLDDDVYPDLDVAPAEANEQDRVLPFVATLNKTWSQTVTVAYATQDGSATAPEDYASQTGVLMIPPGSLSTTVLVPLVEDKFNEPDETLYLRLTNPVQASLTDDEIEGIIHNGSITTDDSLYMPALMR